MTDYEPIFPDNSDETQNEQAEKNEEAEVLYEGASDGGEAEDVPTTDELGGEPEEKSENGEEETNESADGENAQGDDGSEGLTPDSGAQAQNASAEKTFKVRYNHEDVELKESEIAAYAQKGLKYDDIESELKASRELAKRLGHKDIFEMAKAADEIEIERRTNDYLYDGIPEEIAKRLAREDYEKETKTALEAVKKAEEEAESRAKSDKEATVKKEIGEFVKVFPDVKKIPKEVISLKEKQGLSLVAAYAVYSSDKTKKENEVLKQNASSAKKAPVRGASKYGSTGQKVSDPFEEGFDRG